MFLGLGVGCGNGHVGVISIDLGSLVVRHLTRVPPVIVIDALLVPSAIIQCCADLL